MPKKMKQKGSPDLHKDLEGLDIRINEFGEIEGNMDMEKLNKFLDKNVEDKKLKALQKKLRREVKKKKE